MPQPPRVVARRGGCRLVAVAALVLVASAVVSATASVTTTRSAHAAPGIELEPIADVPSATAMAVRPGDPALYVALQRGTVVALREGEEPVTVLDVSDLTRAGGERGLLGLVFSPDGTRLYVHYSGIAAGETVVEEYEFTGGAADPTTRRVLLTVPQPQANHNGGQLAFGPDGYLYIALGDGGGADDRGAGHVPGGNAQSLDNLLGKILRVDPSPSGSSEYTIPPDNPFADGGGRPEIFVYGLRNPWRFSFDRKTGDLWIADVGQNRFEEVTRLRLRDAPGANLGWNRYEADRRHLDDDVEDAVMPHVVTSHDDGNCSITGGYVYRGRTIKSLRGWYVYTDYCNGALRAAKVKRNGTVRERDLGVELSAVSSFGEDAAGELYVLSQREGVFRIVAG